MIPKKQRDRVWKRRLECFFAVAGSLALLMILTPGALALETVTGETVPQETVPQETVTEETVPQETVPEETLTEERALYTLTFHYPDRTEAVPVDGGFSFRQMYPGIAPETVVAEKENHGFVGWFASRDAGVTLLEQAFDFSCPVEGDLELYPVFQINRYTVIYADGDTVLSEQTVEHGQDALPPELPVREGYTAAWDRDEKNITGPVRISAVYTRQGAGAFLGVFPEENYAGARLIGELAEAVPLTEPERQLLEAGEDVTVTLRLTRTDDPRAQGALPQGMIPEATLEATLIKQVGPADPVTVQTLSQGLTVSLELPRELRPEPGTARVFAVVSLEGAVPEAVDTMFDENAGTLSFRTDRMGRFLLCYADSQQAPPAMTPDTADGFRPGLAVFGLVIGLLGAGLLLKRRFL